MTARSVKRRAVTVDIYGSAHHAPGAAEKFARRDWHPQSLFAVIGACAYIAGFAVPLPWNLPLIVLALSGVLAVALSERRGEARPSTLTCPLLIFLLVTGLSILMSRDVGRSLRLSTPFLPGTLLFMLVAHHFRTTHHVRLLYSTFSVVALGLASAVLWNAWQGDWLSLHDRASSVGSPILIEANDITFVAVLAPLSFVLLCSRPRRGAAIVPAASIVATVCAVCVLQSRVAMLTMVISLACAAGLVRRRIGVACRIVVALGLVTLLIDGVLGFPLAEKFQRIREPRISLWIASLMMFIDAPWLGHGPHTFVDFYRFYMNGLTVPTWLPVDSRLVPWAHNLYLELLAEQGIVGLGAFAVLLGFAMRTAWNIQRDASRDIRVLGAGVLASLVGFCVAGVFESSLLRLWVVILLLALLGVVSQLAALKARTA